MTKAAKFHILHPIPPKDPPTEVVQAKDWLLQNSLRLSEIDGNTIGELLLKLSKDKVGERTLKLATLRRRRQALYATFELAVKREYVKRNPLDLTLFKRPKLEGAIDPAYFLSVTECRDYVSALDAQGVDGKRVGTFVSLLWLAGLRPGEALGLKKQDCKLDTDEPRIEVRRNTVQVGKAWTETGDAQITKSPKSRSFGHIRSVPIPSELSERLKEYCKHLNSDSLLFASANDKRSLSLTVFEDAWVKVRKSKTRLYDLRHTNASILIYSGLNIIEVASRLGHSVNVCMRTYLHLLGGHSNNSDKKVEEFLRQGKPRAKEDVNPL